MLKYKLPLAQPRNHALPSQYPPSYAFDFFFEDFFSFLDDFLDDYTTNRGEINHKQ